ncbi:dTDP-4-dehydrorhamnose 3,5-epimerase [Candidatus Pseudothioglobus singularis]|nr:dTDP-4-dehydrorhamnose 3,5-epimerase [Candidatus Pseudothioglobus singularis]
MIESKNIIDTIVLTPLKRIDVKGGDVLHAMKKNDFGYSGFGEAYFSNIEFNAIKAWKRHKRMVLNLVVPVGKVRFVFLDDREPEDNHYQEIIISKDNYCRLTVPPMIWMGFQGLSNSGSILLNLSNIEHDPSEVENRNIEEMEFNWSKK